MVTMALKREEWPGNVLEHMTDGIITTAQDFRLVTGVPMIPSPLEAAHIRNKAGTSRHTIWGGRKSDATDLFVVNNKDAGRAWTNGQRIRAIGGFGIYFDTELNGKKRVMFHIDNRSNRLLWICPSRDRKNEDRQYVYFNPENAAGFYKLLGDELARL